jgi:transcriptional regulator with XRE-family HTH domain
MTQTDFAAVVGVSQPVISAYEHGKREPSLPMLERLVRGAGRTLRIELAWDEGAALPRPRDLHEHAERLEQVLGLADAIPHQRRERRLLMPRIDSRR